MPTAYVIFPGGMQVRADVADTPDTQARGLMFREALDDTGGMLFVFERPAPYAFWMKNVPMPLDIIWIDESSRILWMVENAPPCPQDPCPTHVPPAAASYVLEVAGGFAARHGLTIGDAVTVRLPRPAFFRRSTRGRC